ncbi:hypothetical protein VYU27_008035 [Nannochloropsis oceanica]
MGDQGQPKHIHFGSLEEKEKARLEAIKGNDASATGSAAIQAAVRAGNINIAEAGKTQVMELTDTSREAQDRQALLLRKLEAEKRKRSLVVPTKPTDVIDWLRKHGQPVALFGETVADRRERLREYLAAVEVDGYLAAAAPPGAAAPAAPTTAPAAATAAAVGKAGGEGLLGAAPPSALAIASVPLPSKQQQQQEERMEEQKEGEGEEEGRAEKKQELFYTAGLPELVEARRVMAAFSLQAAPARLARLKGRRLLLTARKADADPAALAEEERVGRAYVGREDMEE